MPNESATPPLWKPKRADTGLASVMLRLKLVKSAPFARLNTSLNRTAPSTLVRLTVTVLPVPVRWSPARSKFMVTRPGARS